MNSQKKVVKKSGAMKQVFKEKGSLVQKERVLTAEGFKRRNLTKSKSK